MDDEGPAFVSFSGLPDENVDDFVSNVESLRKHFKWSSQVTFCYARTMLKGAARRAVQGRGETRADEAADPSSWSNLRASLVFEFSELYANDRAMAQVVTARQEAGESSGEYARRFVDLVAVLVESHPLDSRVLAMLFAAGLRSEKTRWELLLRRFNSIDRAVGFVAPDLFYRAAKLTALLSPPVDAAGLSPASEASGSFTMTGSIATPSPLAAPDSIATHSSLAAPDSITTPSSFTVPGSIATHGSFANDGGLDLSSLRLTDCARSSTANGASFALDDSGSSGDDAQPWPTSIGYGSTDPSGYWTPPRLPDAQQRRQHRQNMAHGSAHTLAGTPGSRLYSTMPRGGSAALARHDDDGHSQTASETDEPRSASELNSLADQLESLSSMLRTQSDARRRRPRLCYRCRQKGHIAADCHLPPEQAAGQAARDAMGTLPRASTVSWRAAGLGAITHSRTNSGSRPATPSRRYTQSWGRSNPHFG
ncbi:hypothetical protein IW148_001653 [Coemansia sp. RSA 1199]|nr:hypothetical protein IW148_001653 [Coemansia sp. RSA 1199]